MTSADGRQWSKQTLTLMEAVGRAPVLVKLEDGFRGYLESLSFSLGDVMALEGDIITKGRHLVLAHYTSEIEDERRATRDTYRSLMTIPWEHLPQVDVRVCQDPDGMLYSNFVRTYFPQHNWQGQKQELLDTLDDDDYERIQEITPKPLQKSSAVPPSPRRAPPLCPDYSRLPPPVPPAINTSNKSPKLPPRISFNQQVGKATARAAQPESDNKQAPPPPPRPARKNTEPTARAAKPESDNRQAPLPPPKATRKNTESAGRAEVLFPSELHEETLEDSSTDSQASSSPNYLELVDGVSEDKSNICADTQQSTQHKKTYHGTQQEEKKVYDTSKRQDSTKLPLQTAAVQPMVRGQPVQATDTPAMMRPPMKPPSGNADDIGIYVGNDDYTEPSDLGVPLSKMTCKQLCKRLKLCGMLSLAKTCEANKLDGPFFCQLTSENLKKPPFSLSEFQINIKLDQVKSGWIPK